MAKISMFIYPHRVAVEIENGTSRQVVGKTFEEVIAEMPMKDVDTMRAVAEQILRITNDVKGIE